MFGKYASVSEKEYSVILTLSLKLATEKIGSVWSVIGSDIEPVTAQKAGQAPVFISRQCLLFTTKDEQKLILHS